jgi:hypothetical protein
MEREKQVDENWKDAAAAEKTISKDDLAPSGDDSPQFIVDDFEKQPDGQKPRPSSSGSFGEQDPQDAPAEEINFINYVTSLGFQAMIFLGEIPHPATGETEKNLDQAKFIIDTLVMIRERTKGNLDSREENILNGSIYELQMKYVEGLKNPAA